MKQSPLMKRIISTEYLVAAILTAVFYVVVGEFDWWWLPISFLLFDITAAGYLINARVGALTYNIGHSIAGPAALMAVFLFTSSDAALFVSLLWLFHIFVDRALGYGLKHTKGFHHTHLGPIGKAKKK